MSNRPSPVAWFEDDPHRLLRDREEIGQFAPELRFVEPTTAAPGGGWVGKLPLWPFDRTAPAGLESHYQDGGLELVVNYGPAYPMVPPDLWPTNPYPEIEERSQAVWHVLPSGALCLLQSVGQWHPEASITQMLMKAAGWRLEYALMKAGRLERMTESGIVSNAGLDALLVEAGA
ncbi:hypothetical protein FBY40_0429 [Microbacterium sp. SLBN-154]|uniref:hypothetical protein n=1 Tax=Microbacterium sp. SLBN-154 TaxID=2768458 RepID=UPI00116B7AC5|nr:hypothetical protein [Microbacterium sp. SLBN-154]TQK17946.1 hypothetical protein FBY40_0429 [Microbacterium sp. SLBN-154]